MSTINLLPWRLERIYYKNNIFYFFAGAAGLAMAIAVFIFNIYLKLVKSNNQDSIDYIRSEIAIHENKAKEISGLKERRKILLNRLEVINSLQANRSNTVNILDKIVKAVPSGVTLTSINTKNNYLLLSGKAESNSRVSVFMVNLENQKIFTNLTLEEIKATDSTTEESQGILFTVEANVTG